MNSRVIETIMILGSLVLVNSCDEKTSVVPPTPSLTIVSTYPAAGRIDFPPDSPLVIVFSDWPKLDQSVWSDLVLGDLGEGWVELSAETLSFKPYRYLRFHQQYKVRVPTGIESESGWKTDSDYSWTFTTHREKEPPIVVSVSPALYGSDNGVVSVIFSEPIDPLSVSESTFVVGGLSPEELFIWDNRVIFVAATPPTSVTLTTGIRDTAGNSLAAPYAWNITNLSRPNLLPASLMNGVFDGYFYKTTFQQRHPLEVDSQKVTLAISGYDFLITVDSSDITWDDLCDMSGSHTVPELVEFSTASFYIPDGLSSCDHSNNLNGRYVAHYAPDTLRLYKYDSLQSAMYELIVTGLAP